MFLSPEDKKAADHYRVMSFRHKVLDRATVVDGRYKVMASNLSYFDAIKMANAMNANPEQAENVSRPVGLSDDPDETDLATIFEPGKEMPPKHNIASQYYPQYRTF